ncbi:MAG: hypothetical protein KC613_13275, partial [Myxococcales bacterium]|nr:hypothetical protein [Myxococcales bacterium]
MPESDPPGSAALVAEGAPAEVDAFDQAALRLRARARWMPAAVGLASLLPYEVIEGRPQFLWDLVGELPAAGLLAYLAPLLGAAAIALARWRLARAAHLAIAALTALGAMAVLIKLGADATAWDVTALPESFSRRAGLPLAALALTAAGAGLTFAPRTRRLGHGVLVGALATALLFYLWPGRGEAPMATLVRIIEQLPDLPHWRFQVGYGILGLLMAWPLLVALGGLWHLARPAPDANPLVAIVALYGLPLMLAMLIFRALPTAPEGWDVFTAAGGIVVFVGVVGLLAAALEVLLAAALAPDPEAPPPALRRPGLIGLAVLVALSAAQWALARPPAKGIEWAQGGPTAEADALFGELLPQWNRARYQWDRRARATTGGQALIEVKAQGNAVLQAAKAIDPALAAALQRLVTEARDLHVAGRAWHERLGEVNAAARKAGLPYYLDPSVLTFAHDGEKRRHFRMRSYRVDRVRRFEADGARFATLRVERLDQLEAGQPMLGFSRDRQPFALVNLAEIRDFEQNLLDGASEQPPVCGEARTGAALPGMVRCGALLVRVLDGHREQLAELIARLTDRHELQHQIDGPLMPMAGAVLAALPGRSPALQARVNREVSAYCAELTAADVPPHLGLLHLAPFALNGRGHYLAHVARIIFAALGERSVTTADGETDQA